jgi:hypothetical protein
MNLTGMELNVRFQNKIFDGRVLKCLRETLTT